MINREIVLDDWVLDIAVASGYLPRPPERNANCCRKVALWSAHTDTNTANHEKLQTQ